MAVCEKADQKEFDGFPLSNDDTGDIVDKTMAQFKIHFSRLPGDLQ